MTIHELLAAGVHRLQGVRGEQAESTVVWGMAHALHTSRSQLLSEARRVATPNERSNWEVILQELEAGKPLQYITGQTQFMDLIISCDERALIPRPETEQLVEWVLDDSSLWTEPSPRIADIGTGTGCIALALAHSRPQACLQATDYSAEALELAQNNASRLGLSNQIQWTCCHLTDGLMKPGFHAIISNPPYIAESTWEGLDAAIRDREPKGALASGNDGLDCIREIVAAAPNHLLSGGVLYMEIGEDQKVSITSMLTKHHYQNIAFRADLTGRTRMLRAEVAA